MLGAGIQGVSAALELAERGCDIDLYDRAEAPVCEASLWNEGKLHLGLVFANDRASRTARTMIVGSLHFDRGLRRWGIDGLDEELSEPFIYAVHRDSMLSVERVEAHLRAVDDQYLELRDQVGTPYLGDERSAVLERLSDGELSSRYDDERVLAAFRTIERSVDPERLAVRLREAIAAHERITYLGGRFVHGVESGRTAAWTVRSTGARAGPVIERIEAANGYDHVVNALWVDRLRVDAALGLVPDRPWLFRYKLALHVKPSNPYETPPPSTTLLLGPFGDVVNFGGRRLYLSWYPACRVASSRELAPEGMGDDLPDEARNEAFRRTLAELGRIVPEVAELEVSYEDTDVAGGVIFTWGQQEITDPASELHERHDIGVHSTGSYHSIDTGKYCMAPYFAQVVADRIKIAA